MIDEPGRWGWTGDAEIADVNDQLVGRLRADPRVAAVTEDDEVQVRIDGPAGDGTRLPWSRLAAVDRSSTGERRAGRARCWSGPALPVRSKSASATGSRCEPRPAVECRWRSSGREPGPTSPTVSSAVASSSTRPTGTGSRLTQPFRGALVRFRADTDADAARRALGREMEVTEPSRPPDVDNLAQLGRLPELLAVFLVLLSTALLAKCARCDRPPASARDRHPARDRVRPSPGPRRVPGHGWSHRRARCRRGRGARTAGRRRRVAIHRAVRLTSRATSPCRQRGSRRWSSVRSRWERSWPSWARVTGHSTQSGRGSPRGMRLG